MANTITLSGYVADEPQTRDKVLKFSLSFYDGKDKNGDILRSYQTVKVYDYSAKPKKGDMVIITGKLHKFKYNEKYYDEVACSYDGWALIKRHDDDGEVGL